MTLIKMKNQNIVKTAETYWILQKKESIRAIMSNSTNVVFAIKHMQKEMNRYYNES